MLKSKLFSFIVGLVVVGGGVAAITSCGDEGSGSSSSSSNSYNGPGSAWSATSSGSIYTLTKTTDNGTVRITADSETLSTGHLKFTVTNVSVTGSETGPSVGDEAYGVEVSGTVLLLKPLEANSETIAMVSSGGCPTADFTANWIIGQRARADVASLATQDWFGTITWTVSSGAYAMSVYRALEDPTSNLSTPSGTFATCTGGTVDYSASNSCNDGSDIDSIIYFTASGLIIVGSCIDDSVDESHIIGIPQVAITTVADVYGTYSGFAFIEDDDTYPIEATFAVNGSNSDLTLNFKSGSDLGTTDSTYVAEFVNSSGIDSPANGMMYGEFSTCAESTSNTSDTGCDIVCSVSKDVNSTTSDLIYCVGQDPGNEDHRITVLLKQN